MIEREFITDKIKQMSIINTIKKTVRRGAGCADIRIEKTPMGEKIIISTVRPGMVIGRAGVMIKSLTSELKSKYKLENPQIETSEIKNPSLSAQVVAEKIACELERFGPSRFKSIGYRELSGIIDAGALGAEITISGKIPGKRAKKWRFVSGYLKKSGNISDEFLDKGENVAKMRPGVVGVSVTIMHADTPLPDKIAIQEPEKPILIEEKAEEPETKETEVEKKPKEESEKQAKEQAKEPVEKKTGMKDSEKKSAETVVKPKGTKDKKSTAKEAEEEKG